VFFCRVIFDNFLYLFVLKGTQCQGAYAFEKVILQELSSRVGENTEFIFLQLEGEIDEDIIENIENAKNYLGDFKYEGANQKFAS
jgi:hypothetical protein